MGKPEMKSRAQAKKPYRSPKLLVHGEVAKVTRAKRGTKNDGMGKPRTRAAGAQA
jgi:hypothetical protein